MTTEEALKRFEAQLGNAGFQVRRSGVNPIAYRLVRAGQNAGQVKIWAPLKPKFNEVRDQWRDSVRACWTDDGERGVFDEPKTSMHWQEVDRLLTLLEPYRDDYLDFQDLAEALAAALYADGSPAPDLESIRYNFGAIERFAKSRGGQ